MLCEYRIIYGYIYNLIKEGSAILKVKINNFTFLLITFTIMLTACSRETTENTPADTSQTESTTVDTQKQIEAKNELDNSKKKDTKKENSSDDKNKKNEIIIPDEISTMVQITKEYSIKSEKDLDINDVAKQLITIALDELKTEEEKRTFVLLDYKNVSCTVTDQHSQLAKDLHLTLDENTWFLTAGVDIIYKGTYSPVGPDTMVPEGEYVDVYFGERYITRTDDGYKMQFSNPLTNLPESYN